jgi:XTP/dITP diphosphohydrolase
MSFRFNEPKGIFMTIVVMSGNFDKIKEISVIFESMGMPVVSIHDILSEVPEIIEDGDTFIDNAIKKVYPLPLHPDRIYLADDSGLSVDALGGRPGVFSARYGGNGLSNRDQCRLLLSELGESPHRDAHYTCAIALKFPDGRVLTTEGYMHGHIGHELKGEHGFGYDPIFIPNGHSCTVAEMLPEEKHLISHRFFALLEAKQLINVS